MALQKGVLMDEVNFHDSEILAIQLDYMCKTAKLRVKLDDRNNSVKLLECTGVSVFIMSCLEPWGPGGYIFSVTKRVDKGKIKIDILFNSGDHIVIGCGNIRIVDFVNKSKTKIVGG